MSLNKYRKKSADSTVRKTPSQSFQFEQKPQFNIDYGNIEDVFARGQKESRPELTERELNICSWNVNGIRSKILRDVDNKTLDIPKQILSEFDPTIGLGKLIAQDQVHVFCLQETKISTEYLKAIQVQGWDIYSAESKGNSKKARGPNSYSGTAIFVNRDVLGQPLTVLTSLPGLPEEMEEGRLVALEFPGSHGNESFWIVNVYTPNSGTNRPFRNQVWHPLIREFLDSLPNVIYCGDMNVARTIYDLSFGNRSEYEDLNPEMIDQDLTIRDRPGFMADERTCFDQILESGFTDTWRFLHPKDKHVGYSYVDSLAGFQMRIDYQLVKMGTMPFQIVDCQVKDYIKRSSDHIPLILKIRV